MFPCPVKLKASAIFCFQICFRNTLQLQLFLESHRMLADCITHRRLFLQAAATNNQMFYYYPNSTGASPYKCFTERVVVHANRVYSRNLLFSSLAQKLQVQRTSIDLEREAVKGNGFLRSSVEQC
uniref:Uncharacterized protein n=1 Tax=Sphaerodactylus townsendi TaxID=933632 RepID=A0ACB8FML7_9SAUR